MAQTDPHPGDLSLRFDRQISEKLLLGFREHRRGVLPHGCCHLSKGRGAARIFSETDGVVVISSDGEAGILLNEFHNFPGLGP